MKLSFNASVRISAATPEQMALFIAYARAESGADDDMSPAQVITFATNELATDDTDWLWPAIQNPAFGLSLTFYADDYEEAHEEHDS